MTDAEIQDEFVPHITTFASRAAIDRQLVCAAHQSSLRDQSVVVYVNGAGELAACMCKGIVQFHDERVWPAIRDFAQTRGISVRVHTASCTVKYCRNICLHK
jgi:hypothetical protein